MAELVAALQARQPPVLLQWEDFGNHNAFRWAACYLVANSFKECAAQTRHRMLVGLLNAALPVLRPRLECP